MRKAAPSLMMTFAITLIANPDANAEIAWQTNLRTAHAQAQSEGKLLLLHFYSDNCTWCEKLEKEAFQEPEVEKAIGENFVPVKVHYNSMPKLAEMFKVTKFPTDVIVTTEGKTLAHTISPQSPDRYVSMLKTTAVPDANATGSPAVAMAPSISNTQSASTQLQAPTSASTGPAGDSYPIPGYASSSAPTTDSTSVATSNSYASTSLGQSNAGMTLPPSAFGGSTSAQLAGSRGQTFDMPGLNPPAIDGADSTDESDHAGANAIAGSVGDAPFSAEQSSQQPIAKKQTELAMQGFCPVTVIREDKWVEGKPEFGVIHLGKLYLFSSQANMQTFLNDPVPYTPVLNEIDAVVFFEERRIVPGKREWGLKDPIYNRMFFFADEASMNLFYNQYERYTKAAIDVMDKAVKDANPGT